jgi:hypothetical protein
MSSRALSCLVPVIAVAWLLLLLAPRHFAKAFWYDEVWVLQEARQPSVAAAIGLARERGSPIPAGYLVSYHALAPVAHGRPWMWRIPSMVATLGLAGGVALLLFRVTASPIAAVVGTLLPFAGPHIFQRYAFEVKPYMAEAAVTVLFVCLAPALARSSARAAYAWTTLALISVAGLFSSQFAAAASWIVAGACVVRNRDALAIRRLAICGLGVVIAWCAMYVAYTGPVSHGASLRGFWRDSYLVMNLQLAEHVRDMGLRWVDACWAAYPSISRSFIALLWVAGIVTWLSVDPVTGAAAGVSIGITLTVSALGHWPLESRMNLPTLVLLHVGSAMLVWRVCAGFAEQVPIALAAARRVGTAALLVVVFGVPPLIATEARRVPADGQDVTAALVFTATHARQDDVMLLDSLAGTNVDTGVINLAGRRVDGPRIWMSSDAVIESVSQLPPDRRAWVPVTHALPHVAALEGRATKDGRVVRIAWSGRGTAVFVSDVVTTSLAR